jgi:cytochrome c peroxidase
MRFLIAFLIVFLIILGCSSPDVSSTSDKPYVLDYPSYMGATYIPDDNKLTVNKVQLGRMLFYDPIISVDSTVSCASCHKQSFAFASSTPLSKKVHGLSTVRNTSNLFNLVFIKNFFWDGRTQTIETATTDAMNGEQEFNIESFKQKIAKRTDYQNLFQSVFGTNQVTQDQVAKAIASFLRTLISANSKFDKGKKEGDENKYLNPLEIQGKGIFTTEEGDCFHCHGNPTSNPQFTDDLFHNNGLDSFMTIDGFKDKGKGGFTKLATDYGKFKTPPLRNLSYTGPFMHDGRLATIDDVLNHYNNTVYKSITIDPNMKKVNQGGLLLSQPRLDALKAFLLTLDDPDFIHDTTFRNPFK